MNREGPWDHNDRSGPEFFTEELPAWILDEAIERLVNAVADPHRNRLIEQLEAELSPAGQQALRDLVDLDIYCRREIVEVIRDLWPRILATYRPPWAILDQVITEAGAEPWQIPSHWTRAIAGLSPRDEELSADG